MLPSAAILAAVRSTGLTAYAVAKASGVDVSVVGRWLKGERDITLATADKIAKGLGLTCVVVAEGEK